jgi:siderophore synthetase component
MPVHPWQWNNKLLMQYGADIANKLMIPLGIGEDSYSPQQSIRTFYNTSQPHKHYVKTAISILSTGNIRGLSSKQMAIAPRVTSWVMNMLQEDAYLQSLGLVLLGEVATVSYIHPYYHSIVDPPYQYKEFLGVLWRESAAAYLQPGERIITMASLLYVDDAGNSFVGDARSVMARSQLDTSMSFNFTDSISFSIDAFNLTDAMRAEYENDPMLPRRLDYDGRTYSATLRASF